MTQCAQDRLRFSNSWSHVHDNFILFSKKLLVWDGKISCHITDPAAGLKSLQFSAGSTICRSDIAKIVNSRDSLPPNIAPCKRTYPCWWLRPFAHPVACCCVLLRVVACCCVLLRVAACCRALLRVVACCCVLLRVVACCWELLRPFVRSFTCKQFVFYMFIK